MKGLVFCGFIAPTSGEGRGGGGWAVGTRYYAWLVQGGAWKKNYFAVTVLVFDDDTNCSNGDIWKKSYTQLVLDSINCIYACVWKNINYIFSIW